MFISTSLQVMFKLHVMRWICILHYGVPKVVRKFKQWRALFYVVAVHLRSGGELILQMYCVIKNHIVTYCSPLELSTTLGYINSIYLQVSTIETILYTLYLRSAKHREGYSWGGMRSQDPLAMTNNHYGLYCSAFVPIMEIWIIIKLIDCSHFSITIHLKMCT